MFAWLAKREELNRVSAVLLADGESMFAAVSMPLPRVVPAELGFLRVVSWLYVHYFETGKIGVRFLAERLESYGVAVEPDVANHSELVNRMRTYTQHNIDPSKPRDSATRDLCESWIAKQCGTHVPGLDTQWERCLASLLGQAVKFMNALVAVLRGLEADGSREVVIGEWMARIRRFHPPLNRPGFRGGSVS